MKLYLAPMEGLTGYVFRNAYHKYYEPMDKYFTPFVSHLGLSHRELEDVLPEHNTGMYTVPQILTNKASDFLNIADKLEHMGYSELNLNLGCPSGTVIKKKRGAGMLSDLPMLEAFLTEIYEKCTLKVSIKTRLGMDAPEEWPLIREIYSKFPVHELIIHPRVQKDLYKRPVRPCWFADAPGASSWQADHYGSIPVCYNGDIFTGEGFERFLGAFPDTCSVMLGRGILKNPELGGIVRRLCDEHDNKRSAGASAVNDSEIFGAVAPVSENITDIFHAPDHIAVEGEYLPISDRERFRKFHAALLDGYREVIDGDKNVLFKMKELWFYVGQSFPDAKKELKTIKKAQSLTEYKGAVASILRDR